MRIHIIALAAGVFMAAAAASQASTPDASGDNLLTAPAARLTEAKATTDGVVIARRGRGADDPAGDDNGGRKGGKGGKGRGGHDDGPNHDRNDDHGNHGPNHT